MSALKDAKERALSSYTALQYAPYELRNDVEFMSLAIARDSRYLMYGTAQIKKNRAIVMRALQKDASMLYHVLPESNRRNRAFLLEAISINPAVYKAACCPTQPWENLNGMLENAGLLRRMPNPEFHDGRREGHRKSSRPPPRSIP